MYHMKPLNPKQSAFVQEYLKDRNATQAAIRVGYSAKTAHVSGPRLLSDVRVAQAVREGMARIDAKAETDAIATYEEACSRMTEILRGPKPYTSIQACDRLAKLRGWDQPTKVQTQDVTPPKYDLSRLSDEELGAFEAMLSKVQPS